MIKSDFSLEISFFFFLLFHFLVFDDNGSVLMPINTYKLVLFVNIIIIEHSSNNFDINVFYKWIKAIINFDLKNIRKARAKNTS